MSNNLIKSILGNKSNGEIAPQNESCENDNKKNHLDFDLLEDKEYIYLESAYQNQECVFRRATESNCIILGELLEAFEIGKPSLLSLAIAYRDALCENIVEERVIVNPDEIWTYDLFSCILKNKTDDGHYTKGMLHETTLIVSTNGKNCILVLSSLGGPDTIKYMRVSVLIHDNSIEDDGRSLRTQNH